jgi:hypothetical protein
MSTTEKFLQQIYQIDFSHLCVVGNFLRIQSQSSQNGAKQALQRVVFML